MQTNGPTRRRLITVALAPAAALAAWGIVKALGADFVLKDGTSVDASDVVAAAVVTAVVVIAGFMRTLPVRDHVPVNDT